MIIGLCGPEGAGKSTAARMLSQVYGLPIRPFAAPLKAMLEALGVPPRHIYGTPAEKLEPLDILGGKSARQAMQTLGTEWGRDCLDPELWVRAWAAGVPLRGCVADDLRFPNEQAMIKSLGGIVICVVRDRNDFNRIPKHASEDFAAIKHDAVVVNNRGLDHLLVDLTRIYESSPEPSRNELVLDSAGSGASN